MKRPYVIGVVVLLAIAALVFFLKRGGSGSSADKQVAQTAPVRAKAKQQVVLQTGGEVSSAVMEDDPGGDLVLEGQVIDDTDDPVGGAVVTLDSNPPRMVKTEKDGSFTFDKLVGRPYRLVARHERGVAGPVTARLTRTNDPVILRLKAASAVEVTVLDAKTRKPVPGATVELRDMAVQIATADATGVAKLDNVVPGGYRLAAYAPGFAKSHAWMRVPAGDVTAVTRIELRGGSPVAGRVLDPSGKPVKGAAVLYSGASDWAQQADPRHDAKLTDKDGRFKFDALPAGTFRFVARMKGYAAGRSELTTLDGLTEKSGVDISLEEGVTVRGKVVSDAQEPMASSRVRVSIVVEGMRWDRPRQTYTDDQGEFELGGLPRKKLRLVALHETANSSFEDVDMRTGPTEAEVTLVLDVTGVIAGIVVNEKDEPIEGAQVSVSPAFGRRNAARANWRMIGRRQELSDAGGKFEIRGIDEGMYNVRATPPGVTGRGSRWIREPVEAKAGDADVRIVLESDGGIEGKVTFADGSAPEMYTIGMGFRSNTPFANKDGSFSIEDLPARKYTLVVRGAGFDTKQLADVEVKTGEMTDVGTIEVRKGRTISGKVTRNGSGVPGATVRAGRMLFGSGSSSKAAWSPPFARGTKDATTDEYGEFTMYGVGMGDLSIVAEHEEYGRAVAVAVRGSSESVVDIELPLQPYGALAGIVTKDGKPAEDVRISTASQTVPGALYGVQTGADGKFRYDRLAPDTYKVSAMTGRGRMGGMGFHPQVVTVKSGETVNVELDIDGGVVTMTVEVKPQNQDDINFAFVNAVQADITVETARQLTLATAQVGDGYNTFGMSMRGNPAKLSGLVPGNYTVCVTPYPTEVSGMQGTFAYMEREGDNMKVYCKKVNVPAEQLEQTIDIPVEIPQFIPPTTGEDG